MNITELMQLTDMNIPPETVVIHFLVTLALSLIIYQVYRMTYAGVAYAKSFNVSLILTAVVTSMVMMVIGNNLALSLGMVGALSIVRFRSSVKEPKDISYIYWAIAVGLSAGTGSYAIAIIGTIFISFVLLVFSMSKNDDMAYLLVVKGEGLDDQRIKTIIKRNTRRSKTRTKNIGDEQSEFMYEIYIRGKNEAKIISELKDSGVDFVNIIAYNNDIGR